MTIDEFNPDDVVEVVLRADTTLGAILEIQSAIQKITRIANYTRRVNIGGDQELDDALAELEQAVRWLKGGD